MANKTIKELAPAKAEVGAAVAARPTTPGYYCHQCQVEFCKLNSNGICPFCLGTLVEKVPRTRSNNYAVNDYKKRFCLEMEHIRDGRTSQLMPVLDQKIPVRIGPDSCLEPMISVTEITADGSRNARVGADVTRGNAASVADYLSCKSASLDGGGLSSAVSSAIYSSDLGNNCGATDENNSASCSETVGSTSNTSDGKAIGANEAIPSGSRICEPINNNVGTTVNWTVDTYNRHPGLQLRLSLIKAIAGMDLRIALLHIADYTRIFRGLGSVGLYAGSPWPKEKSTVIYNIEISENDVKAKLQCSVCLDEFHLREQVCKLSCAHIFHGNCILQWLALRPTCPVCRKWLDKEETGANVQSPERPPR